VGCLERAISRRRKRARRSDEILAARDFTRRERDGRTLTSPLVGFDAGRTGATSIVRATTLTL
jgi:hypothetical protein